MTITKAEPYTKEEIESLREEYDSYIKTVIDIDTRICVAGMKMHADGEKILLKKGAKQSALWGGGIDVMTGEITYNSFINIRPNDGNRMNFIESEEIRAIYKKLTEHFFQELL